MAKSLSVMHFYGFYLGRPEGDEGWQVAEVDEYGTLPHPWANPHPEGDKGEMDLMRETLLRDAGYTDEQIARFTGFALEGTLGERCGVDVIWHGRLEWWDISLAAHGTVAENHSSRPMPATRSLEGPALERADANLERALRVLGVTPRQERAEWLTAPVYA